MPSILGEEFVDFPDFGIVAFPAAIFIFVPSRVPFHGGVDFVVPLLVLPLLDLGRSPVSNSALSIMALTT